MPAASSARPAWSSCRANGSVFLNVGYASAHKHRPAGPLGVIRWATWRRGRLAGLVAETDGEFWTPPLHLQGRELRLNMATQPGGGVRVEVQNAGWEAHDGYHLADASVLHGDQLAAPVTWGESTALPDESGDGLVLRFQLDQATLFGFELR